MDRHNFSISDRLPRYRRVPKYPIPYIGRPKHAILSALGRFHYLSARQLALLAFSPGSLTYVQDHLKQLYHAGFVERLFPPKAAPGGSPVAIYALDKKGYRFLSDAGRAPVGRFRSAEQKERELFFLEHTRLVNDVLILAHRLGATHLGTRVAGMRTERELKRLPVRVADPADGKTPLTVVPDGWLDLRFDDRAQMCLAVELDRGTVERERFQRKIRGLVAYSRGPYQQAFGTESLTVVFVTTKGERRLEEMLAWTERELSAIGAEDASDLFRFAALQPTMADPSTVFFSPLWLRPFERVELPLIELRGG